MERVIHIKEEVANLILEPPDNPNLSCVIFRPDNPFTWKSGTKHPIYTDLRNIQSLPVTRREIINLMLIEINDLRNSGVKIESIAPVHLAGVPFGAIIASDLFLPMTIIRDEAKDHGTGKSHDGIIEPGVNYLVIEDLFSTGGSSIKVAEAIRNNGGRVSHVLSVMTYEWPATYQRFAEKELTPQSLTDFTALYEEAIRLDLVDSKMESVMADWKNDPMGWAKRHGFE